MIYDIDIKNCDGMYEPRKKTIQNAMFSIILSKIIRKIMLNTLTFSPGRVTMTLVGNK